MFNGTDVTLLLLIVIACTGLAVVIALSNERQRRATLRLRDVMRDFALSQLRLARAELERELHFTDQTQALAMLAQVAHDACGQQHRLEAPALHREPVVALVVQSRSTGGQLVFTPSVEALRRSISAGQTTAIPWRRGVRVFRVDAVNSSPTVVAELQAVIKHLSGGYPPPLPRSEHWDVVVLPPVSPALLRPRRFRLPSISLGGAR